MTIAPPAPAPSMLADDTTDPLGRRIAFINNKGGVGKSTAVVQLAAALARRGRRVLVIDMDPQANATGRLAVPGVDVAITIGELLRTKTKGSAAAAITRCGWDTPEAPLIGVIPSDITLAKRDTEAAEPGSFGRLARVLLGVTDDYDYTLIDCRPTLGHLEQMVVRALDGDRDGYYLVVEPGRDAITGAIRVRDVVAEWADDMDVDAPALGVVINLYDDRLRLHKGRAGAVGASMAAAADDDAAPVPVLRPYIPRATRIAEVNDLALAPSADVRLDHEGHLATFDALAEQVDAP
jgi:cellulose biosynthesis protein BcsQ